MEWFPLGFGCGVAFVLIIATFLPTSRLRCCGREMQYVMPDKIKEANPERELEALMAYYRMGPLYQCEKCNKVRLR